jgi:hypothetical protein
LAFDPEEMQAAFGDATDFDSVTQGMTAVGLDPWYTYGDERYFEVLNGSSVANAQIDLSLLYDRYYNRSENLEPVTQFTTPSAPDESCPDGSSAPCETTVDDPTTGDGGEAANTTQTTDDGSEEGGLTALDPNADLNPETAESEQASAALTLLAGIVVVLGLMLLIVSRQPPGELSEKVTIDAMWDNASTDPSFVPAPPPLKPMTEEEETPSGKVPFGSMGGVRDDHAQRIQFVTDGVGSPPILGGSSLRTLEQQRLDMIGDGGLPGVFIRFGQGHVLSGQHSQHITSGLFKQLHSVVGKGIPVRIVE